LANTDINEVRVLRYEYLFMQNKVPTFIYFGYISIPVQWAPLSDTV